ncbi:Nramp family divalent metal transporter [Halobacillus litoralis]|uniref:Nramp family divalent metal transporter n=1 Tax=Halobacillus litoralis TaxID=45668 RepID=UPI001CD61D44|nr:Nramp family divalent metal transporter [Halobacillus litoralis]MCA1023838.1 Nramp family divalent metal transporter [Halobacillus litoralis]
MDSLLKEERVKSTIDKKSKLKEIVVSFGPGIIAVLSWLGAGDLVSASVSGASYGYSLMWVLAISMIIRYVIVNVMARFQLCNNEGITLVQGFGNLNKGFAGFLLIYTLIMGHMFLAFGYKGAGEALASLIGIGSSFIWSLLAMIFALFVLGRNIYKKIENVMKVFLALMTISFIGIAIATVPDIGGIVKGTVGFSIPSSIGVHGALLVAISLIGAVAGSIANFIHPYFMREKGWVNPSHKKLQRRDLMFGIVMVIIIDLAIWIVGAEVLNPRGIEVNDINDLSQSLSLYLGHFGFLVFYLGVFCAVYSSVLGYATGLPKLLTDALQILKPHRREKYGEKFEDDPMYKWFGLFLVVTPIVWSVENGPTFVSLTLVTNALNIIGFPVIALGLLFLSNKKSLLGKYTNNWLENIILFMATVLAVWSAIQLALSFF